VLVMYVYMYVTTTKRKYTHKTKPHTSKLVLVKRETTHKL